MPPATKKFLAFVASPLESRTLSAVSLITGLGLVTPLGHSVVATWDALLRGQFINDHTKIQLPDAPAVPRVTQLARRAAAEAIREAGWTADQLRASALVVGTSKGPVESWLDGAPVHAGLSEVAADLAESFDLCGPRMTLSAACASGLHALIRGVMMLQHGQCERVLVVAAEASVHPLFLGSFKRLGVLPPESFGCRPFDKQRAGFLMSDAAAAVCIESNECHGRPALASERTGRMPVPRVAVERFAFGNDATHLTAADPNGIVLRRLLTQVVGDNSVDLVHAHGTGTVLNDAMELAAIEATVRYPATLYSHKGAIGHTLGAAGLISIVLNCMAMRHATVPPNIRASDPLPTDHVKLSNQIVHRPIRRSLALAAGFGGPTAVVSLCSKE